MNHESMKSILARWLPLLVGICVAMPGLLLWRALAANEQVNVERMIQSDAERVEEEITERVRQRALAFVRMARRWEVQGKPGKRIWEEDARLYFEHFPGTQGVTWVDGSYRIRWIIPVEGNEPALGLYLGFETRRLETMEEARRLREVRITSPIELVQGGKGIIVFAPIFTGERFDGFIDGVFRTQEFIDSMLRNIAPGYFISISSAGEEIFRRGNAAESVGERGRERTVTLYGTDWRVRVAPTRGLLEEMHSATDEVLLAAGFSMALIFALTVRLAQNARRRASETEAARVDLEKEIGQRQQAEETLRQSEAKYRSLVNNIPDVMWTSDCTGKTVFISPNFERLSGYPVSEAYENAEFWFGGIHPEDVESVEKAYDELIECNVMFDTEYRFRKKDGTWMWVRDRAVIAYEKDGIIHVDGMFTDITERRRTEEEIRRLNAELELKVEERTKQLLEAQEELSRQEKLAMLGRLSGSVGHELRNPLGVMNNAVYFLKTILSNADETVREYLCMIEQEVNNSQRIITDLLDFARTKPPQQASVPVFDLVGQSLGKCDIPGNVTVDLELPEAQTVKADPLQMEQVLRNLITNAVQAMPDGGALTVAARRILNDELRVLNSEFKIQNSKFDGDFIEISVADTGEGISPDNMKKLFQPLFTTKAKGIGLGLVVCRNLVEANGGRIDVESRPGEGTTFTVALPAERGES